MKNLILFFCMTCICLFTACNDSNEELIQNPPANQPLPDNLTPKVDEGFIDIMLNITSATATGLIDGVETDNFWYQNQKIDLSFDGKPGTHFNSKGRGYLPVTLTYYLADEPARLDYFIYFPRQDNNNNGNWGEFEMQYQNEAGDFLPIGTFDFKEKSTYTKQALEQPVDNPKAIRFIIKSGYFDQVSCSEIQFFQQAQGIADELFTDLTYSELKPGLTREQIQALPEGPSVMLKQIALALYDKTYDHSRIQMYQAYPEMEKNTNKLGAYNRFENPTGIYFKKGDLAVIFVGETQQALKMKIVDWSKEGKEKKSSYPLIVGTNTFTVTQDGLAYIENWTDDDAVTIPDVKIHMATGQVNGWFDYERGDDTEQWHRLLSNGQSECDILDIRGKYIQLAVDKPALIKKCPDRGRDMIEMYDRIVRIEQELMGMYKYDWRPVNRMFARRSYGGNPNANDQGVSFPDFLLNPENIANNSWVIGHELGHINQIRPNMKWHGTTEVTNNIYSAWVQYQFTPHKLRLEHEDIPNGLGSPSLIGGRFSSFLLSGIINKEPWMFQKGNHKPSSDGKGGDFFVRLIPFWQLQLYAGVAKMGPEDFFPDLLTKAWKDENVKGGPGKIQLNFIRSACDLMQQDLTDYFEKVGMLTVVDREISDYGGDAKLTITAVDVEEMKAYASKYQKPATPVLYYLSGNSVEIFRDKLSVTGTLNEGVTVSVIKGKKNENFRTILVDSWKNAIVYETYQGDKLTKAAICGTGFGYGGSTIVSYPEGSTCIKAVSWDGKRTVVYNVAHN